MRLTPWESLNAEESDRGGGGTVVLYWLMTTFSSTLWSFPQKHKLQWGDGLHPLQWNIPPDINTRIRMCECFIEECYKTLQIDTHNYFYFHCKTRLLKGKINPSTTYIQFSIPMDKWILCFRVPTQVWKFGKIAENSPKLMWSLIIVRPWKVSNLVLFQTACELLKKQTSVLKILIRVVDCHVSSVFVENSWIYAWED